MLQTLFRETGVPPEVVVCEETSSVALMSDQIRVQLHAAPINPADINFIEGRYGIKPELPAIPGMEGCGEVIESKSSKFSPGDKVVFRGAGGSWAEEVTLAAERAVRVPQEIDSIQAAMLSVNPLTALRLLEDFEELSEGDVVVQNAGNSNVGRCLIQLAKRRGLRTISTVRRPELVPELEDLGGDHVLVDDQSLIAQVKALDISAPKLAINCVCGESATHQLKLLAPRGTQVTYGAMAKKPLSAPPGLMIFKELRLAGFWVSQWTKRSSREEVEKAYTYLAREVADGRLTQAVDQTFPLTDVQAALTRAMQGERNGKVLLVP